MPTSDATQHLPIVLKSSERAFALLAIAFALITILVAIPICLVIAELPKWPSIPLLLMSFALAMFFGWLTYRTIGLIKRPNTLILDKNGVTITLGKVTEFVKWRDIAAVRHTSNGIFGPQNVVLHLNPDAILKRLQSKAPRLGTETFVQLGSLWKTDRVYNSRQIAALIEECREQFGSK